MVQGQVADACCAYEPLQSVTHTFFSRDIHIDIRAARPAADGAWHAIMPNRSLKASYTSSLRPHRLVAYGAWLARFDGVAFAQARATASLSACAHTLVA